MRKLPSTPTQPHLGMSDTYFLLLLLNACVHTATVNSTAERAKPVSYDKTDLTSFLKKMKSSLLKERKKEREVPGWGVNVRRETTRYIDPVRDTTIISGQDICKSSEPEILIVIQSIATHWRTREAIRHTWANLTVPQVKVAFMIGSSPTQYFQKVLERESEWFKDIIQESLVEAYYNLTLKSISTLKWFLRSCPTAKFLLKADEDTFIDIPLLVHRMKKYGNSKDILRGYVCSDFERDHRLWSKWYAPKYMYGHDKYPDFLQGSAYYMSRDVAEKLFQVALHVPIFHLEDVYITGLCARKANVTPRKDFGVEYLFDSPIDYCLLPHIITCNSVGSNDLQWVLDERRRTVNYSNIDDEPALLKAAMQTPVAYEIIYPDYTEEIVINPWKTALENGSEALDTPKLALQSDEISGGNVKSVTRAYVLLIFVWHHASSTWK